MDELTSVFEAYGADMSVLEEYDCVPLRARIVRDMIKIRTSAGVRTLKRVSLTTERLEYIFRCLEYAASRGFPNVPRMIRNRYGDAYVVHPTGMYYMTAWLPGREANFRKFSELLGGTRMLANWHLAMEGFRPVDLRSPGVPGVMDRLQTAITDFEKAREMALSPDNPSPFQRLLLASAVEVKERCEMALERLRAVGLTAAEQEGKRRGKMCHGNFHKQNVVFDGESLAVLHYEGVHPGIPITDLAFLLHRYMPAYEWDPDIVAQLVDGYLSVAGHRIEELAYLDALLALPLRTLQVISWHVQGTKDWDEEDYVDYLETCLGLEEAREEARRCLQDDYKTGRWSADTKPMDDSLTSGWQTATFTIQPESMEMNVTDSDEPFVVSADIVEEGVDQPVAMSLDDVKDGILVVRPSKEQNRAVARRRRSRRKEPRGFRPVQPGLRLWGPNEHRREDDKE